MFNKLTARLGHKKSAAVICIAAAVILIAVNALIALLPSNLTKYDTTPYGMYTLGENTVSEVKALKEPVDIYIMMYSNQSNETMVTVLERYRALNSSVKVHVLDMEKDAEFISGFTSSPQTGNIIVKSEKRSLCIPYFNLFYFGDTALTNAMNYYNYYYQQGVITGTFNDFLAQYGVILNIYDGYQYEEMISSAIRYVTSDEIKNVYMLKGHKELPLSSDVLMRLMKSGVALSELSLLEKDIPADCDGILLLPNSDITELERQKLTAYTENGGKVILGTMYGTNYTELYKFTELFGLTSTPAYLFDDAQGYCFEGYNTIICPDISSESYDKAVGEAAFVLLGGTNAISQTESLPAGVTVTPILTTSKQAYTKSAIVDGDTTFNAETDVRGQYYAAASATNAKGGSLVWLPSSAIIYDDYDYYTGFGNKLLFMNAVTESFAPAGDMQIEPSVVTPVFLDATPTAVYIFLGAITIVPLILVGAGYVYCHKRKYA
ncbi:MAG: hypothetical protein E7634_06530 [Ruminococcaceae bacterium]|nr:hypothetical protein [Oscillospiraceae bacterium]